MNPSQYPMIASLQSLGLPSGDAGGLADSPKRFPDGAQYRFEIPSTETPKMLKAVIEEADQLGVTIHRMSQGSGVMMLTDAEIREMLRMGKDRSMEVNFFVGPRANYDIGGMAASPGGKVIQWQIRGQDQFVYALEDIKRACDLGCRSILLADFGLIQVVSQLRAEGKFPRNLIIKTSAVLAPANAATCRLLEQLGGDTLNLATDLTVSQIGAIRQATKVPIDLYVEVPDGLGGYIRHYETPEIIRVGSPVYVKFGVRNSPDIYPMGQQFEGAAIALSRERVRRCKLVHELIQRYDPKAVMSKPGAKGLGIPEI